MKEKKLSLNSWERKQRTKQEALPGTNLVLLGFVGCDHCNVSCCTFLSQQRRAGSHHRSSLPHVLQGNLEGLSSGFLVLQVRDQVKNNFSHIDLTINPIVQLKSCVCSLNFLGKNCNKT